MIKITRLKKKTWSVQDVNRRESLVLHTLPLHQILDSLIAVALRCKMKKIHLNVPMS